MIRKALLLIGMVISSGVLYAQDDGSVKIDKQISQAVKPFTDAVSGFIFSSFEVSGVEIPYVVIWLVLAATIFTFYFGFINVRGIRHSIKVVKGDYDNPDDRGEVTHFQALATALSGTVGLGNIAGVAVAISAGGPGATFWMMLAGFLSMTTKFVECTLGVKYRNYNQDGSISGGPMYYLTKGLKKKNLAGLGKVLAVLFSILCVGGSLGGGNMFQGNQAAAQVVNIAGDLGFDIGDFKWAIGLILALFVGLVIIGGIKSIARVTEKVVPFMCILYVVAALIIVFRYIYLVPDTVWLIIESAFDAQAMYGGFLGVLIWGFQRAAFSNEAGVGSASIAHSAVKTEEPISEGLVGLLEPFVDTIVVCAMTAFVTIITGEYLNTETQGIEQTSAAFGHILTWFPWVLSMAVVLFAFSTMLSWSYYGLKAWTYIFGNNRIADVSYKLLFCTFIVVGAAMSLSPVILFSDAMIFAMSFANIIGMYILSGEVKSDLNSYLRRVKSGEIKKFKKPALEGENNQKMDS